MTDGGERFARTRALRSDGSARDRYLRLIAEGSALERTIAFSDAVFAIAMTILVLELHVPDVEPAELPAAMFGLLPQYLTFALSFVVVGVVWLSHHRKFAVITHYDQRLLRLNLLLLLLVASLALPTAVLGEYGDQPFAAALYAGSIAVTGLVLSGIWVYAWRRGFVDDRLDAGVFRYALTQSLTVPAVFLLSIPVAYLAGPLVAEVSWAAAIPVSFVVPRLQRG